MNLWVMFGCGTLRSRFLHKNPPTNFSGYGPVVNMLRAFLYKISMQWPTMHVLEASYMLVQINSLTVPGSELATIITTSYQLYIRNICI